MPIQDRVTPEFLDTRVGAADLDWLAERRAYLKVQVCRAAVLWYGQKSLYHPCMLRPYPGEDFCTVHGGTPKDSPTWADKRKERQRILAHQNHLAAVGF